MESSGVVLRQTPSCFSSSSSYRKLPGSVLMGRRAGLRIRAPGFGDNSHMHYYYYNKLKTCEEGQNRVLTKEDKGLKKKKKLKKQLKLLKGLSTMDLGEMGSGRVEDKAGFMKDAAEILLERPQKLKAEEKELKRKKKEEKARLKATQRQNRLNGCEMSSSSSSESSDSDCGEVVDMNRLKRSQRNQDASQPALEQLLSAALSPSMSIPSPMQDPAVSEAVSTCCIEPRNVCARESINSSLDHETCMRKIEVCMGGKCRKSGAATLLQEFERVVGIEGAVSGCKCMGKCRDGPNVRVLNGLNGGAVDDSVRTPANPLCIGVGLEDVDMIVANFLGEGQSQPLSFAV